MEGSLGCWMEGNRNNQFGFLFDLILITVPSLDQGKCQLKISNTLRRIHHCSFSEDSFNRRVTHARVSSRLSQVSPHRAPVQWFFSVLQLTSECALPNIKVLPRRHCVHVFTST